jgi:Protein of unknown function (DUF1186)
VKDLLRPKHIKPLHHAVIEYLFDSGSLLHNRALEAILQLPRESAIEDLISVIQLSLAKYDKAKDKIASEEDYVVVHALLLLMHFRAEEKLPFLLAFFSLGDDYTEPLTFILDIEFGPGLFYHCGKNSVPELVKYIKDFGPQNEFSKINIFEAFKAIAINQEDRKAEIIEVFYDLLGFVLKYEGKIDSTFKELATHLVDAVVGLREPVLLGLVKQYFERDWVKYMYRGGWPEYHSLYFSKKPPTPVETYDDIKTWYNSYLYEPFEDESLMAGPSSDGLKQLNEGK